MIPKVAIQLLDTFITVTEPRFFMRSQLPKCRCKCSWLDPRSNHPPRHNFHRSMRYLIPYPPTGLTKAWFKCPSLGFSITKIWLGFCGTGVTKDCECSLNNPAWKVPCPFQNTFNICKIDCYGVRLKSHAIMQRITGKLHKHSFLNWNLTSI